MNAISEKGKMKAGLPQGPRGKQKSPIDSENVDSFSKESSQSFFSRIHGVASERKIMSAEGEESGGVIGSMFNDSDLEDHLLTGGIAGAVIGGIGGVAIGALTAQNDIAHLPVQSVTHQWQQPVLQNKNLGEIPQDYYQPGYGPYSRPINTITHISNRPVIATAPVFDSDGKVKMEQVSKTWSDHGKPVTRWQTRNINDPVALKGYDESVWEQYHMVRVPVGTDGQGNVIYRDERAIDGWHHSYTPRIDLKTVGQYREPSVNFETGINVGGRALTYGLIGVAVGSVVGAVVGAILSKASKK